MKILYKLTTRSRPQKMWAAIDNIRRNAVLPDTEWEILVTVDENDRSLTPYYRHTLEFDDELIVMYGHSKSKIDAINRDMDKVTEPWDIVVATSDDIVFLPGFDAVVYADYLKHGPDVVLHYGDGYPHGLILTVPIYDHVYYERDKFIYNPEYVSLFCDEEAVAVGRARGRIQFCTANIMRHDHPAWGATKTDAQYRQTESYYPIDKKTFERRKAINFGV